MGERVKKREGEKVGGMGEGARVGDMVEPVPLDTIRIMGKQLNPSKNIISGCISLKNRGKGTSEGTEIKWVESTNIQIKQI